MGNKNLRDERYKILRQSTLLQQAVINEDNKGKAFKIKKKQNEVYKKWKFYDGFIKAQEKTK